ncbi:MAG TPA: hypothetical protein VK020_10555, partial [Microlunatus sp.]|nr:hypothetical protein [Microlunatus sp.]
LRDRIPSFDRAGVRLTVVSGDLITDTITVRLLERAEPGTVAARAAGVGTLLTVAEFADAEVAAALDALSPTGHTVFVDGRDYLA